MAVKAVQVVINGQTHTLTYNATTKKYEATITAPSTSSYNQNGHYYNVKVKATDEAGNSVTKDATDATLGSSLQLKVKEKVAPVISITAPSSSAKLTNNKPVINWTVTDADSGVNPSTIKLIIDSQTITTGITKTQSGKNYTCSYTPTTALSDGTHTIKVSASDYDGNVATQKSVTFTVDTVPPELSVSAPVDNLVTNQSSLVVKGTTNDVTSSPVTLTIKLNGGTEQTVEVGSDGSFTKTLTLVTGENTIVITAKDGAGKTSTVTKKVVLDQTAPVIQSVTISPNPVNAGATYTISVEVTD
ncbi:Ig-like domain-containing protein [Eubacterium ventriosum]|uniref:Ig-like domain-containing protein n=1 Tax=Eubacterium ventriosum TaxID=39496 RepID=UPI00242D42E9|nr:Ig-like domain-containing protein [Eubacterium ventriosum]